jgi:hypothetical protein
MAWMPAYIAVRNLLSTISMGSEDSVVWDRLWVWFEAWCTAVMFRVQELLNSKKHLKISDSNMPWSDSVIFLLNIFMKFWALFGSGPKNIYPAPTTDHTRIFHEERHCSSFIVFGHCYHTCNTMDNQRIIQSTPAIFSFKSWTTDIVLKVGKVLQPNADRRSGVPHMYWPHIWWLIQAV